ncbi:cytochrome c [Azohydromonas sediminis]|uniref:cytochrome c n=1 Tax=Azohydromonas sediminis TaxID=2259674 RepID=UPI000E64F801|nr:cytochrome c [Azohydromonas sediminis]
MTVHRSIAALVCALAAAAAAAQDARQFVEMPAAARENLRREMVDNLAALQEIVSLMGAGRVKDAGEVAEKRLGLSAMGKNRDLPLDARPGARMPPGTRDIGTNGHKAASAFAAAAAGGDATKALAAMSDMPSSCAACHLTYRTR